MKEIFPRITVDAEVLSGKPVIKGTRVPVDILVGHVASGDSIEDIAKDYLVTNEDVLASLRYAAKLVSNERVTALP